MVGDENQQMRDGERRLTGMKNIGDQSCRKRREKEKRSRLPDKKEGSRRQENEGSTRQKNEGSRQEEKKCR